MAKKSKDPVVVTGQLNLLEELGQARAVEYTSEQEEFIFFDEPSSVILAATAGSGKTFSSVQRLKALNERGVDPNKIIFLVLQKLLQKSFERGLEKLELKLEIRLVEKMKME